MTQKSNIIRMRHMMDAANKARSFIEGKTRIDLDDDEKLALALARLVEIIGEAASKIPESVRNRLGHIPWKDIVGTRNRLIHGYEEVDNDVLWEIVKSDLPKLSNDLAIALQETSGPDELELS
jgi:uncharacterized protein with HEPN domain